MVQKYMTGKKSTCSNIIHFLVQAKDPNSTIGTGPCAKWFKGEDCPFYPNFIFRDLFRVSCTDAEGSYCDCIWFCWNNKDVAELLDKGLKREDFSECTTSLKSSDEALPWKEKQCKDSKKSKEYKENEQRCKRKNDKPKCAMLGVSFHNKHEKRNILKYCYRLIFIEITNLIFLFIVFIFFDILMLGNS